MIVYVTIGGMKGTTWVQIVKAVLLIAGTLLITFLVLRKFNFNISDLLGAAADNSGKGAAVPGARPEVRRRPRTTKLDFISLGIALVLGTAGLPHILIRFYTVPTAKAARKSVLWAIGLIGAFYLMTLALGFGAAALLDAGRDHRRRNKAGNTAAPAAGRGGRRRRRLHLGRRPAGGDLGGRLRHDPRGRRRPDPGLVVLLRPRHLRQRHQEGQGHREAGGAASPATRPSCIGAVAIVLGDPRPQT